VPVSTPKNKADNIKGHRFKKGISGNPKGRPKNTPQIGDILRKIGKEIDIDTGKQKLTLLMESVYDKAIEGQSWAVLFIAERTEGKVKESDPIDKNQINEITFL